MLNDVPVRIWLLIAITAAGFAPARYVYRYFTQSLSARDITQSAQDFDQQNSNKLPRNLAFLVALIALAVFIFTPAASDFAHSPSFLPILTIAMGAWALSTVFKGAMVGKIEPIVRGFRSTYERNTQPKRFWASFAWNAILGLGCLWIGFHLFADAPTTALEDRCYDRKDTLKPKYQIIACGVLIGDRKNITALYLE